MKKPLPDRRCAKNNEYYIQIVRVALRHAHTQRHRGRAHTWVCGRVCVCVCVCALCLWVSLHLHTYVAKVRQLA